MMQRLPESNVISDKKYVVHAGIRLVCGRCRF